VSRGVAIAIEETEGSFDQDRVSRASAKKTGSRTSCPPAGEARSRLAERIFRDVIRAVRSGGQDVRDPFLKIKELVQSFLKFQSAMASRGGEISLAPRFSEVGNEKLIAGNRFNGFTSGSR
jgi:hypothetical protein